MKTRGKLKINLLSSRTVLFFLLLPYFKPVSIEYIAPGIDRVFDLIKIFSSVVTLALYINKYILHRKISKFIFMLCLFEFSLFFSTILNNADYRKALLSCVSIICFCMLTELAVKNNGKLYFETVFRIYFWELLVNMLLLFIYPNGLAYESYYFNKVFFITYKNGHATIFIPLMALMCIYSAYKINTASRKKLTPAALIMLACISVTTVILWSATEVVGWFIMLMYIMFIYKSRITEYFNSLLLFPVAFVLQICVVFLRIQDKFAFIIWNILRKNITFTGRTQIWDISFTLIKRAPIFGYGVYEGHGLIFVRNLFYYSHNVILEIMLQGGIIALILFAVLCIQTGISLYRNKEHCISGILTAAIFSVFVMMLMEAYIGHIWVYGLMTIASCVPDIIEQIESPKKTVKQYAGELSNVTNPKLT